jgi:hypothetical protein
LDREPSVGRKAESAVNWTYDALARSTQATSAEDRQALRQQAAVQARLAEALAMRDLAASQRELAHSNDKLAAVWQEIANEMRQRRGAA